MNPSRALICASRSTVSRSREKSRFTLEAATEADSAAECEVQTAQVRPRRISWARLLKRVLDIDILHCPNCGAEELKIIAAILERQVIEKILTPPCRWIRSCHPEGSAREAGQD